MQYADEYAASLEPVRYAKPKPLTAADFFGGEAREIGAFVRRVAMGRDPHASSDMVGLAKAIHEGDEWHKLPIFADAVDDAGHPAGRHYDLRNAEDAVHQLSKWGNADGPPANWKSSRHYIDRRKKFADALRRLGRHDEAAVVGDHKRSVLKFHGHGGRFVPLVMAENFDRMTRHYAETALWSSHDMVEGPEDEYDEEPLDRNHSIHDIDAETSSLMADDVRHFRDTLPQHLRDLVDQHPNIAGHALWLSRNGHGAGLFDRTEEFGVHADDLHDHATDHFGEHGLYIDRHTEGVDWSVPDGQPIVRSVIRTNQNWRRAGGQPHPHEPSAADPPF